MCILWVPKHPWCHCADPTAIDMFERLTCPHHILVDPRSRALHPPLLHAAPDSTTRERLDSLLVNIARPEPSWQYCPQYRETHTNFTTGVLALGHEYRCPMTCRLRESKPTGHVRFYAWDGLCSDCCVHNACGNIPLQLIPLRERWVVPETVAAVTAAVADEQEQEDEDGFVCIDKSKDDEFVSVDMVRDGLEMVGNATKVSPALENKMLNNRSAWDGGEGVFVDVVETQTDVDKWSVFIGRSALYLLPGYQGSAGKPE